MLYGGKSTTAEVCVSLCIMLCCICDFGFVYKYDDADRAMPATSNNDELKSSTNETAASEQPQVDTGCTANTDPVEGGTSSATNDATAATDTNTQTELASAEAAMDTQSTAGVSIDTECTAGIAMDTEPTSGAAMDAEPTARVDFDTEVTAGVAMAREPTPEAGASTASSEERPRELPFQVQIVYTDLDGAEAVRVLTQTQPVTRDRQQAETSTFLCLLTVCFYMLLFV